MKKTRKYLSIISAILLFGIFVFPSVSVPSVYAIDIIDILKKIGSDSKTASVVSGDYSYLKNNDSSVTLTDYTGDEDELVIPSEIDGYQVSALGDQFLSYIDLKSLVIPETVTVIGSRAFEYCDIAETCSFPENITIGQDAFAYAFLPDVMIIPEGAVLGEEAFAYCKGLETLSLEAGVTAVGRAFNYSKDLKNVVCAEGTVLEERAFEYCDRLETVYLCGDVEMEDRAFDHCDRAKIMRAEADEAGQLFDMLQNQPDDVAEGLKEYHVSDMTFCVPSSMIESSMPGYGLFLMDENADYLLGSSVLPPSVLDFETDEAVETMVKTATGYVTVENAGKVRICGYPAVWINIVDEEADSVGVYLFISTEENMYYMMFLDIDGSREVFFDIADSITIGGITEGTDFSDVIDF